jgi:hypothetical protein
VRRTRICFDCGRAIPRFDRPQCNGPGFLSEAVRGLRGAKPSECAGAGKRSDRATARVRQEGMSHALLRRRTGSDQAVFGLKENLHALRYEVCHQCRDCNSEIYEHAWRQFSRDPAELTPNFGDGRDQAVGDGGAHSHAVDGAVDGDVDEVDLATSSYVDPSENFSLTLILSMFLCPSLRASKATTWLTGKVTYIGSWLTTRVSDPLSGPTT